MTRPWIKFHTTNLDDVRILRLNERQQLRYYQMYLLAGRLNADGLFVENNERLNEVDIAIKLRVTDRKQFTTDFNALKKAGLIKINGHGPYIEAFDREQVDWSRKQEQDRERKAKQRHGSVTRDMNVTEKKSRVSHASVTPLDQTKTKTKTKIKKKKEIKNQPPPIPSSSRMKRATVVGGGDKEKVSSLSSSPSRDWMSQLSPVQRQTAEIMTPILTASGLGKSKIITLLSKVATRIEPAQAKEYVLAALASVYADKDVTNKPVVAAYRMENDQVTPIWTNTSTWQVIPAEVLKVAGIQVERTKSVIEKVAANVSNR